MTRNAKPRGQAMVEFALIFPIFILLLVGIFDLGRVIWVNDTLATASREAARFAIVHGGKSSCPVGPPAAGAEVPTASTACPYPAPSRQAIKDVAHKWAAGTSANVTVHVCYGAVTTCTSDTDAAQRHRRPRDTGDGHRLIGRRPLDPVPGGLHRVQPYRLLNHVGEPLMLRRTSSTIPPSAARS